MPTSILFSPFYVILFLSYIFLFSSQAAIFLLTTPYIFLFVTLFILFSFVIISRAITILAMLFYVACSSSLATGFVRLLEPGINYSKTVLETSEEMNAWPQQWSLFPSSLAIFSPLVITRFFASLDKFSVISVALLNLGNMGGTHAGYRKYRIYCSYLLCRGLFQRSFQRGFSSFR